MNNFFTIYLLVSATLKGLALADHDIEWLTLDEKIPIPISDMTATYVPNFAGSTLGDSIVIAGGCSDEYGNSLSTENGETGFYCGRITDKSFAFDPYSGKFSPLLDMPVQRYRHAAAYVDAKLYLVGGRSLEDNLIPQIDVFDPKDGTWSTLMNLPDEYLTSDNAAVAYNGMLYVIGGYDSEFNALNRTLAINVETKEITVKTDMRLARGDAQAVSYAFEDGRDVAFIMGGFTPANGWCAPLHEGEVYDFVEDTWTAIPSLNNNRGDKAVVTLNGKILTFGGESKHESSCDENTDLEPESYAVTVDDVESYDPRLPSPKWEIESDLSNARFRAAAAAFPKSSTVYLFGGQAEYLADCQCYKNTDTVYSFHEEEHTSASDKSAHISLLTFFVSFFFVITVAMI